MSETPHQKLARLASEIRELVETEKRQQKAQRRAIVAAGGNQAKLVLLDPFPETISSELAEWFLKAVERCVAGDDLGKALGLKPGRGAPRRSGPQTTARYKRARRAFFMREFEGKSWKVAADELDADTRDLQKDVARYKQDIIAEFASENRSLTSAGLK